MRIAIGVAVLGVARVAAADFANNEALHAHVEVLAAAAPTDPVARQALVAHRASLSLGALVPILGTYRLDHRCYGEVRPAAYAFDWVVGGLAPAGLGIAALAESGHTRAVLAWTAVGLYASTRIGILVIANLHVSEYNRYLRLRLGVAESSSGQPVPLLATGLRF